MSREREIMESLWSHFETRISGMTGDENNMVVTLKNGKVVTIENYIEKEIEAIINEIEENR